MEIRDRIKQIRIENKLSQEEFGKRLKISRSAVSKLESGENEPSDQTKELICSYFNINREWIEKGIEPRFSASGDDFTSIAVAIDKGDPKARQAIIDYWKLSSEDKELFWRFIKRFAK